MAAEQIVAASRMPRMVLAAILVTFFPCGILYPLSYPTREIANLLLWIWAFPSPAGIASMVLVPLFPSATYGYYAFNLFCVLATLGTAARATRWLATTQDVSGDLHRLARTCMIISLLLAVWQGLDGAGWLRAFPAMFALGDGRGGGLRPEPSLLAPPLALYLGIALCRHLQAKAHHRADTQLIREAALIGVSTLVLTRSLTVAIVLVCFLPAFAVRLKYLVLTLAAGSLAGSAVLWARVHDALSESPSFSILITAAVGSWRNVPDLLIFLNYRDFLWPTNPAAVREKLNFFATLWSPFWAWLDNTYSTFSASVTTLGLLATTILFVWGLRAGRRSTSRVPLIRLTWTMLYVASWFFLPKYEICGWLALGLLVWASQLSEPSVMTAAAPQPHCEVLPDPLPAIGSATAE